MARRKVPILKKIAKSVENELTAEQKQDMNDMLKLLDQWDFKFDEESVGATVYSFAVLKINKSLFYAYEKDAEQRSNMVDGYLMPTFIERMVREINKDGARSPLNRVCK